MPSMPTREALRALYDTAILEIDQSREEPRLTTGFYAQIGDAVFEAAYSALGDFCTPEPDRPAVPRLHVVSATVGSGKTSFSLALITALIRHAAAVDDSPQGCVFLVDRIAKAEEMYIELSKLLPGKVAIWTADHDKRSKRAVRVTNPSARHDVEELADYPVVIVTHAFYSDKRGDKAKLIRNHGQLQPRALTVVDEHPKQVTIHEIQLSQAERVREFVRDDQEHLEAIGPHMDALITFMRDRADAQGSSIEKPTDAADAWRIARELDWFAGTEAQEYANSNPIVTPVFAFAKALARGYAFIARGFGGQGVTHFIGYESALLLTHGALLLDATADIDGVTLLCPWRVQHRMPEARYDNLEIVHVPQPTKQRLSEFLKTRKNHKAYAQWMEQVIKDQMDPGQYGLVVCKKVLLDYESIPTWPEGDQRFVGDPKLISERYGWELDGRHLCAIHWGAGIGDNAWKEADIVFLFDEFHIPKRSVIATAQGLQGMKATDGVLASMRSLNTKVHLVDGLREGHLLRWTKQMALRGRGRCFDGTGTCGQQKLVFAGDLSRLLSHFTRLFPGAKPPMVTEGATGPTMEQKLYAILSRTGLPKEVSTKWLGQQMRVPWRNVSKNLLPLERVQKAIDGLGWSYVSRPGRGGACFRRLSGSAGAA